MLPVTVILPFVLMLPVPTRSKLFRSRLEPKAVPAVSTGFPPTVVPSPTYSLLVSVVYTNSPSAGVISPRSTLVPLLSLKAIYH